MGTLSSSAAPGANGAGSVMTTGRASGAEGWRVVGARRREAVKVRPRVGPLGAADFCWGAGRVHAAASRIRTLGRMGEQVRATLELTGQLLDRSPLARFVGFLKGSRYPTMNPVRASQLIGCLCGSCKLPDFCMLAQSAAGRNQSASRCHVVICQRRLACFGRESASSVAQAVP